MFRFMFSCSRYKIQLKSSCPSIIIDWRLDRQRSTKWTNSWLHFSLRTHGIMTSLYVAQNVQTMGHCAHAVFKSMWTVACSQLTYLCALDGHSEMSVVRPRYRFLVIRGSHQLTWQINLLQTCASLCFNIRWSSCNEYVVPSCEVKWILCLVFSVQLKKHTAALPQPAVTSSLDVKNNVMPGTHFSVLSSSWREQIRLCNEGTCSRCEALDSSTNRIASAFHKDLWQNTCIRNEGQSCSYCGSNCWCSCNYCPDRPLLHGNIWRWWNCFELRRCCLLKSRHYDAVVVENR